MVLFTLPTSRRVTQDWGQDFKWLNGKFYPNGFYSTIGWRGHNGIDYGCPVGDPVESVCDGVVEYVGPGNNHPLLTGGGNVVLVRNDKMRMRFEYLHLSQQNVYTGQRVKRGQVIALSGNTGVSSGPHLHIGAIPVSPNLNNGYRGRVDPTAWLYGPSNPDYAGAGLAAAGTTTPAPEEEDDMFNDQDRANLVTALDKASRAAQVAQATEDRGDSAKIGLIFQMLAQIAPQFRFFKGPDDATPESKTLYELAGGELRGISFAEWQAKGGAEPAELPQEDIDKLLPKP